MEEDCLMKKTPGEKKRHVERDLYLSNPEAK